MERTHIAFFGRRNAGKSSLVNRFTSQELSIVSDVAGTTTDPVRKTMELLPLGPVIIIDTPGIDDEGKLGNQRIERSIRVLDETDIAILVVDGSIGIADDEKQLIDEFKKRRIPYLVVMNKSDLGTAEVPEEAMVVSALKGEGIEELKEKVAVIISQRKSRPLVSDLVEEGDLVVLVVPIDKSAPKDRLILPQQMVIRDLLGKGAIPVVVKDTELAIALEKVGKVRMVITDSQAFAKVSKIVPDDIPLTSFSILMARFKGILDQSIEGANVDSYNGLALCALQSGDPDSALVYIGEGLALEGNQGKQELYFNEIVAYERKLDFVMAREKCRAYAERYPTDQRGQKELTFLSTR